MVKEIFNFSFSVSLFHTDSCMNLYSLYNDLGNILLNIYEDEYDDIYEKFINGISLITDFGYKTDFLYCSMNILSEYIKQKMIHNNKY